MFNEIAAHLSGARKDRLWKRFYSLNRDLGEQRHICEWVPAPCPKPYALFVLLDSDGELDEEGRAFGFVVSYPDISIVIRNDGVDDGQP